jgi:chlorite dismutase
MSEKTLNHYTFFSFNQAFWGLLPAQRSLFYQDWAQDLRDVAASANFYQVSPLSAENDGLLWCAQPAGTASQSAEFFGCLGRSLNKRRAWLKPNLTLWGYTKPSLYARGPSDQEIDPLAGKRASYLVMYPFVKTIDWYLLSKDTRQGMMNEHIRIGRQYPEIKQLLLYSFGLQDQEFIVIYEMEDLGQFSDLVNELRGTEVRRYTHRDEPVYTAILHSAQEMDILNSQELKSL